MRGYRDGQVGLMLLVVMGVVVSLVLSIASRSFTDITLSRRERESNASFAIAESGVEEALLRISQGNLTGDAISDAAGFLTGDYNITPLSSYDLYVEEGETAQIDLSGTPSSLVISWEKPNEDPGTCAEGSGAAPAAIEVTIVNSSYKATRYYYNANNCNLSSDNGFDVSSPGSGGFVSSVDMSSALTGSQVFMRIKPLYHGTTINVTGSGLADQLYLIQSKASGGDVRTDIEVKRSLESAPSIFDFALFSNTTIIK